MAVWRKVSDGFFTVFSRCFSGYVHLDVESQLSGEFSGALDDQQLLVIEGSCCAIRLREC